MALIQWSEALSVDVEEIDEQHYTIIKRINEIYDSMNRGKGQAVLGNILECLTEYTVDHFNTEEKYFERFGYPEAEAHREEHTRFVERVTAFEAEFKAGKIGLSSEILNFLKDWLTDHIQGSDKKYGPFFNENGLT